MKRIALTALVALAACGNGAKVGSGDIADALTTYHVIDSPLYQEVNPLIQTSDPLVGAVSLVALAYVGKATLIELGVEPDTANRSVDTLGWTAACHNLAFFAGSGHPLGLLVGAGCGYTYWNHKKGQQQ